MRAEELLIFDKAMPSTVMDEQLLVNSRVLLHEANFSHYHRGYSGYVVPCSGIDCHVPVFVIALAAFGVFLVLFVVGAFLFHRIRYKKAFQNCQVPARMLLGGTRYGIGAQHSVREEKDKFMFHIERKVVPRGQRGEDADEDGCSVCLKARKDISVWILLQCSHELCERCFNRIVHRSRLHSTCPLCRKYLAEDMEGDGDRGPLPATQGNAVTSSRARQTETETETPTNPEDTAV